MTEKVLKAVRLEAENTMRLRAIEMNFDPDQNVYVVAGENAQGKSSALNVIAMLLGGRRLDPPRVVRDGEEEARAELVLDDGHVVRCHWKVGHPGKLEVLAPSGQPVKAPQTWLQEKIGRYSFDPVAWLSLKEEDATQEVINALGLKESFTALDAEHTAKYAERTLIGRERDRAAARLTALPKPSDDAPPVIDMKALLAEQDDLLKLQSERLALISSASEAKTKRDALAQEYRTVSKSLEQTNADIASLDDQMKRLSERRAELVLQTDNMGVQLKGLEERGSKAKKEATTAEVLVQQAPNVDMKLTLLREKLEQADQQSVHAAKAKERTEVESLLKQKADEYDSLTKRLDAIDVEKAKKLAAANFPVPGLTFSGQRLLFNGLPFTQASQAERLRVAVAMGMISKPELRILLVREGSFLDKRSMALLARAAAEYDAQVVVEVVGKDRSGPMIVIEDGLVAEVRTS